MHVQALRVPLRWLGDRGRAHLPEKIGVLLGLSIGICAPYFYLQRNSMLPAREGWNSPLDLWIAFDPRWIWAYASLALLVPLSPLLTSTRDGLARYARGLSWLCLTCFAAFLLFPVAGPRPAAPPADGLYGLIVAIDRPLNSMPSLHAGLAAYSLLHAWRVLRDALPRPARALCVALGVTWGGLILFSTLATKQHWVVDLPGAILIACAAHAWVWRSASRACEDVAVAAG